VSIQVAAILDLDTVTRLLEELTPFTIQLGDADAPDRWFAVDRPTHVAFVPGAGVRIHTTARLRWSVAGVGVTCTIQSLELLLAPVLAAGRLNIVPRIEDADLKNVPQFIDREIVERVNERLAANPEPLGWSFARTLTVRLGLPPSMAPVTGFELDAGPAALEVTADAIRMAVVLPVQFRRSPEPPVD
jgi:hypothetical protein